MKRVPVLALACALSLAAADSFESDRYLAHIKFLASPELKGRATGSPELEQAARYISDQFRSFGLKPPPGVIGASAVIFAGYGITAPEYNYDDYAGIDAKGKIVIVLAHEPQEFDPKSVFEGKVYTDHSQLYSKASNAKAHGARGLIMVKDTANHPGEGDELMPFGHADGPNDAGILFVQVTEAAVKPWFQAVGKDPEDLQRQIDADLKPRSFALGKLEARESIDLVRAVKSTANVVAYLPGETDEYIVIGAHYDHLGLGGPFSLAPSLTGTVHPGADDNASGTAGVIELARYFSAQPKPKRGFLFITFAGEELGLLGSGFYAGHPELPLAKAVTMINLDMIGRITGGKLYVGGAGTGTTLRADLDRVSPRFPDLKIDSSGNDGYGSSDHTSFTAKQVPVLFFFSGLHGDYHKPSDTWDKIDSVHAVELLQLIADVATGIDKDDVRPRFVRVEPKAEPVAGAPKTSGGGYGPDFGSIPDFAEPPKGVRFADVRNGSPAALSGLKPGDILIKFGDKDISNLYDFTYALRAHKPGDEVLVQVLRGGETITANVKLTERK